MIDIGLPEQLPRRAADLAILCEIGEILNSSVELDEVLSMILIGVTAGQGLRFNRAFLLLVDQRRDCLEGRLAIGPDTAEEAATIWTELDHRRLTLREMLLSFGGEAPGAGWRVRGIAASLKVSLQSSSHVLVRALSGGGARIVHRGVESDPSCEEVAATLGVERFALVPIVSRGGPIGVLLADNAITQRPIEPGDLDILRLFANHAGTAIEKARLYSKILEEKTALETAHNDLRRNQQTIIGLQRLSDLGEMAARVAHEIRNPLVSIGGFARRMLATTEAADDRRKYLEIIASEVARLETILGEVLDYARPPRLKTTRTDLNALVREMADIIAPEGESLGVDLEIDLDRTIPTVAADTGLMKIALLNLLRNALQAIPARAMSSEAPATARGGRVLVRTRNLGRAAEVSVQDNGEGVPAGVEERIFEPFFTTKASGSGLGLAIVAQILRQHGGGVRVQSRPAEGATFYLDLPLENGSLP